MPLTQPGHHYISDQKNCHSGVTPVPAGTASLRAARARSASCLTHWVRRLGRTEGLSGAHSTEVR